MYFFINDFLKIRRERINNENIEKSDLKSHKKDSDSHKNEKIE